PVKAVLESQSQH
ncbi:hypothetical protein MIMGU_mgv1a0233151mg, partial [Erythranthe guttata]